MSSTKILIATVPDTQGKTYITSATSTNLRTMLPAKPTAVTIGSSNNGVRPRPSCLADLDPKPNPGPRKRQRLNHLSPDEKLMRRKMKNRVAAQTARDRKKALMERLEDKIYEFEVQQTKILDENSLLRARNQKLEAENRELRKRLCLDVDTDAESDKSFHVTVKEEAESPESAALDVPPQQEQAQFLSSLMAMMFTWSLMFYLEFLVKSMGKALPSKAQSQLTSHMKVEEIPSVQVAPIHQPQPPPWWGPQQQTWNPSKN